MDNAIEIAILLPYETHAYLYVVVVRPPALISWYFPMGERLCLGSLRLLCETIYLLVMKVEFINSDLLRRKFLLLIFWVAVISAKNHKRQRRKRQSVAAKREKSQTPKLLTAILTLPYLT